MANHFMNIGNLYKLIGPMNPLASALIIHGYIFEREMLLTSCEFAKVPLVNADYKLKANIMNRSYKSKFKLISTKYEYYSYHQSRYHITIKSPLR